MQTADALIIGGGPAGLSAALVLARALRSVTLLDADSDGVKARSSWPQVNHNLLGWPDGIAAAELRARGRQQLSAYPVEIVETRATDVQRTDAGFVAQGAEGGAWAGRVLLLATGVGDRYPDFPGWQAYVGRTLHWCIACDGYDAKGTRIVAIGDDLTAALDALQLRRFSDDVTLVAGSAFPRETSLRSRLEAGGVRVVQDVVVGAEGPDGRLEALITRGGERIGCDHAFSVCPSTPHSDLARELGVPVDEAGFVCVDSDQQTRAPGIFAAGDLTRVHSHQLATALHEGTQAGHAMNHALLPDALRG